MLQSGMRAPMGIKVRGPNLETIEKVGLELEKLLKNNKRGTLFFQFNHMGKPVKIVKKGVGLVKIWYDNDGKIIKIKTKPKEGRIASVVISTFNELFGLLKYAGI